MIPQPRRVQAYELGANFCDRLAKFKRGLKERICCEP